MRTFTPFIPPVNLFFVITLSFLISCAQPENQQETTLSEPEQTTSDEDQIDIVLPAMYTGRLPCADCSGIQYQLILDEDRFSEFSTYEGKSPTKFKETGTWNLSGDTLTLVGAEDLILKRFLLHVDSLTMLNMSNNKITGELAEMYVLERTGDQESIREHHQDLARQGFRFFAAGNEPFWSLKVDSLNQLIFESPEIKLNLGETNISDIEDVMKFGASADSVRISVQTNSKYCQDSMSGYLFPQTVTAVMQSSKVDTLRGCGLFLHR